MLLRVEVVVKEIKGRCPLYKVGDKFVVDGYYISSEESCNVCLHALGALLTLLTLLSHGHPPEEMGIGKEGKAYLTCPDPGPPCTEGGSVLFELRVKP